jgi:superfamily II DNA or RNA helicase
MELRPYQEEAAKKLTDLLRSSNSTSPSYIVNKQVDSCLVVLPTGAGKTFTMISWIHSIKDQIKNVVWACHRDELKRQAYDTFRMFFDEKDIAIWDAKQKDSRKKINIVMIPSARNFHLPHGSDDPSLPTIAIFDEAHHMEAPTWNSLLQKVYTYRGGMCVGITATPIKGVNRIPTIYEAKFYDLVKTGHLARPTFITVKTKCEYNFTVRNGEFTSTSLAQLDDEDRNTLIFNHWKDNRKKYGKILIFCASVAQSKSLYDSFRDNIAKYKYDTKVHHINGSHTHEYRKSRIESYQKSTADIMINCSVFTEGFDDKTINTVFLCRPTMSPVLYKQMIGRGSRITDSKSSFNVVDFVDVIKRYELARNNFVKELTGEYLDEELAKDEEKLQKEKELKQKIKVAKLTNKQKKRGLDAIEITGWIDAANKYTSNRFILVKNDVNVLASLFYYIKESWSHNTDIKNVINESYGEVGFATIFDLKEWKNICWSIAFITRPVDNSARQHGSFRMEFFDPADKPTNVTPYLDLAHNNILTNLNINKVWEDKESLILDQVIDKISKEICPKQANAIKRYMKPVSYKNRIFSLEVPAHACASIVYQDIGILPGLNSLKIWKKNITNYLRLIVSDNDAEVATTLKES